MVELENIYILSFKLLYCEPIDLRVSILNNFTDCCFINKAYIKKGPVFSWVGKDNSKLKSNELTYTFIKISLIL